MSEPTREKRRFQRSEFKKSVRYKGKTADSFSDNLAQDISQGGIRLNSNVFHPVGSQVTVQVQLEPQGRLYDLNGKVIWVKHLLHLDVYQFGVEFEEGEVFERWKIAQFVVKPK